MIEKKGNKDRRFRGEKKLTRGAPIKKPPEEVHVPNKELGIRQKQFCEAYLSDPEMNATKAAMVAGYSKNTAYCQGPRLLKDPRVQEYIAERMKTRNKETGVSPERVLAEVTHMALDDMGNYVNWETDEAGNVDLRVKSSKDIDTRNIREITYTTYTDKNGGKRSTLNLKLYDKTPALITLGKHLGIIKDRVEVDIPNGITVNFNIPRPDKEKKLICEKDGIEIYE